MLADGKNVDDLRQIEPIRNGGIAGRIGERSGETELHLTSNGGVVGN